MIGDRAVCGQILVVAATDRTLSTTIARVSIPVSLIYGSRDLIVPAEIGQTIYRKIQTLKGP
jgi:esterase/lipase